MLGVTELPDAFFEQERRELRQVERIAERQVEDRPAWQLPLLAEPVEIELTLFDQQFAVPVRVPSVSGSAWNDGTLMIVKFGTKPARSAADGRRNKFRAKMLAHAVSV